MLNEVKRVAGEFGRPPAEVALAWAMHRPGVAALLLGVSKPEQLDGNLAALEIALIPGQLAALDTASARDVTFPYAVLSADVKRNIFGGTDAEGWRA